jgi:hypothetical protein
MLLSLDSYLVTVILSQILGPACKGQAGKEE